MVPKYANQGVPKSCLPARMMGEILVKNKAVDSLYEVMKPSIKMGTYQDMQLPPQASRDSGSQERILVSQV